MKTGEGILKRNTITYKKNSIIFDMVKIDHVILVGYIHMRLKKG